MKTAVTEFVADGVRRILFRNARQARRDLRNAIVVVLTITVAIPPQTLVAANAPTKAGVASAVAASTSVAPAVNTVAAVRANSTAATALLTPEQEPPNPKPQPPPCGPCNKSQSGTGGQCPLASGAPVYLNYGSTYETDIDMSLSTPLGPWEQRRSYMSDSTAVTGLGNKWLSESNDNYLVQDGNDVSLIVDASSQMVFTGSGSPTVYAPPSGNSLRLTHDTSAKEFTLTDTASDRHDIFHDFTVSNATERGKLKERSTRAWYAQGKGGFDYAYTSAGKLSQITTPEGQDYSIKFSYTGNLLVKIELTRMVGMTEVVFGRIDYTYYGDVTTPSSDLGSAWDLVQIKVSESASNDAAGTRSIVRYTQYRYDSASRLTHVFEHDAVQRAIDELGLTDEADMLKKDNDYGTPDLEVFANRRFTYYAANTATTSITTPFAGSENLNSTYGASECAEAGFVKSETIRSGCGSCGSSGGVTMKYFYLDIAQGAVDQNEVTRLIVEDTEDSDGNAHHRKIQGVNSTGRKLREVFIDDPTGSPTYWCESWKMEPTGKPNRLAEYRKPSAHTLVDSASELRDFLDPYDSEGNSWTNDTNTQNASDGYIEVHSYSAEGMKTDSKVKKGRTGTAYYTGAWDYGDGDSDSTGDDHSNKTLMIAEYAYYDKTTTRADGKKTSYSYTFHDSADTQIETKTTTLPVIPTSQNGSGVATTSVEYIDEQGRLRWTKDGEGYCNYYSYDPETGELAFEVVDVNPTNPGSDVTSGSAGAWEAWTVGDANNNKPSRTGLPAALALATKRYFDEQGRKTKTVESGGASHYTAYEADRTIQFPYWDSAASKCLMPIQVIGRNDMGQVAEAYAVRANFSSISIVSSEPTGFSTAPSQSDYVSWTRYGFNETTGLRATIDRYHDIPSSGTGTLSTNYHRSISQTDAMGRPEYSIQVVAGSTATDRKEQVTQLIYDVHGRVIRRLMGVSGNSAANGHNMTDDYDSYPTMTIVSETEYDEDGVGDGHVTQTRKYHGTGSNDYTGVNHHLTYRGHARGIELFYMNGSTETSVGPYSVVDVNWHGQPTASAQFTANPNWSSVVTGDGYADFATSTATNRGSLTETSYDDLGRYYRSNTFAINASTGAKGSSVQSDSYYDRKNRVVATQPKYQSATELAYDGVGRQYQSRRVLDLETAKYTSGAFSYRDPQPDPAIASMTGGDDDVIAISHTAFDEAGNATERHLFDMNHDDTGVSLGIDLSNDDDYVRASVYMWYDSADRVTVIGNYGSGDTTTGAGQWKYAAVPSRPATAPSASGETVLVTAYSHDVDTGRRSTITDPRGYLKKTFFDDLGRDIWVVENYDDFDPNTLTTISDGSDDSKDRVTKLEYDANELIKLTAYNGSSSTTQDSMYLYEDTVSSSRPTVAIYPDSSDTTSSGNDQVEIAYNVDGSVNQKTDQRGTVIVLGYNVLRWPQSQKVTTLGGDTDGAVRSITRGYDSLGRVAKVTSHGNQTSDPDNSTDIINQIVYTYNNLGQIIESEQSHSGAVTGSTPSVQFGYDHSSTSGVFDDGARMESVTYPDGRVVFSDFGTAGSFEDLTQSTRRLRETTVTGTVLADYSRTGAGVIVLTDYQQPDLKLDSFGGTSGTYAGMDRFGRTIDHRWYNYTTGTNDLARYKYGYDYSNSRTWKEDSAAATNMIDLDEFNSYDGLNRLTATDRGDLNSGKTSISTLKFAQDWDRDQLGNWANFTEDSDGDTTDDLDQDRTHNDANEITDITETTGPAWITPVHDAAGNITTIPQPTAPASAYTLTWDAWNRLVKVVDGANTVAEYEYDGKNRRVVKSIFDAGTLDETRHMYLSRRNQILEERVDTSSTADRQFVWGIRYIDDLILRARDTDDNGTLDESLYALQDANWNVTAISDTSGIIVERLKYTSYGESTVLDANFADDADGKSDYRWEYRFTSREFDAETNLQYFRSRYYDSGLGRFLRRDPLGYVNGGSLYSAYFVPNRLDPWGLASLAPGVPPVYIYFDPEVDTEDFLWHYEFGGGSHLSIPGGDIAQLLNDPYIMRQVNLDTVMAGMTSAAGLSCDGLKRASRNGSFTFKGKNGPSTYGGDVGLEVDAVAFDDFFVYGNTNIRVVYDGVVTIECECCPGQSGKQITSVHFKGKLTYHVWDRFANPTDIGGYTNEGPETDPYGTPYGFSGSFQTEEIDVSAEFPCGSNLVGGNSSGGRPRDPGNGGDPNRRAGPGSRRPHRRQPPFGIPSVRR